jgi:hypothetical protein
MATLFRSCAYPAEVRVALCELTQPSLDDAVARKALPLNFDLTAGRAVLHKGTLASEFSSVDALCDALRFTIKEQGFVRNELQAVISKFESFLRTPCDHWKLANCLTPEGSVGNQVCKTQNLQTLFSSYEVSASDVASGTIGAELGLRARDHVCGGLAAALRKSSCTFPWLDKSAELLHLDNGTQIVLPVSVKVDDHDDKVLLAYTFTVHTPGHFADE